VPASRPFFLMVRKRQTSLLTMIRKPWALVPALLMLLTAAPLFAQEHEEAAGPLDVNTGLLIWTLLIFGIVVAVLYRFAWPNILGAVEKREAHIRELLEGAERDRAEAAQLADENRKLIEETRARTHDAINEARGQAEKMRAEVLETARREQQELLERARRDIAAEREVALDSVRREAVELAIRAAEKLVRRNLDAEDNRRLVREFLGQVGEPAARA
jgi:F-type H+-transporting ATPase subunit b